MIWRMSSNEEWDGPVHRYQSPYRPFIPMSNELAEWGIEQLLDDDQIGPWTREKVYTFSGALPADVVSRVGLIPVMEAALNPTVVVESDDGATSAPLNDQEARVVREVRHWLDRTTGAEHSPAAAVGEIVRRFAGRWDSESDLRRDWPEQQEESA